VDSTQPADEAPGGPHDHFRLARPVSDDQGLVVLGGGLAGLAAALCSGAPLYEADARTGGVAASDTTDGFTFDRGIHILQTRNPKVLALLDELGVELKSHSRNAFIHSHGTYTAYPFQVNTAGLPIGLRLRCVSGFFGRGRHPAPANYEEWMYRALGEGFARTFLMPYSEKFWTVPPREMTFEWTGSRVPRPSAWQVVRGALWSKQTRIGTNVDFRYPLRGAGFGAIADAMRRRLGRVHPGHRAVHVDTVGRRVHFQDRAAVDYRLLISTLPLPELVRICPDAPDAVRAAAARLRHNSVFVVNLGIDRAAISDRHWVHFPEKDVSFFRLSYPHNFGPEVAPPGTSSISAEVAYSQAAPLPRDGIVERVIEDLVRVGALGRDDPVVVRTTRDIRYGYCIYDHARKQAVHAIHAWLRTVGIEPAGRYGLWTYFWSDESILSGRKAAEKALQALAGQAALASG
jgi:UDP-galactopyranose mutase